MSKLTYQVSIVFHTILAAVVSGSFFIYNPIFSQRLSVHLSNNFNYILLDLIESLQSLIQ